MTAPVEKDFVVNDWSPAYHRPGVVESLPARVAVAREQLAACCACPRTCCADRVAGKCGFCGIGRQASVVSAVAHFGEEDCLRGTRGSGTIFFGKCNLRCVFCQNWDISQYGGGRDVQASELASLMLRLQGRGCHNVNLVSPSHVVLQLVEAIPLAIEGGLSIPIVYNSGGYDSVESLRLLEGLIDIYMPDFKFWRAKTSGQLCGAEDYPERAREAIREMHRQVGDLLVDADGVALRGLLVRHLVLPGHVDETREIMKWIANEISCNTFVNVMGQYHPDYLVSGEDESPAETGDSPVDRSYGELWRKSTRDEIKAAYVAAREAGLWRIDG